MVKKIIAAVFLLLTLTLITPVFSGLADNVIRVAIFQDAPSFYIKIKGNFEVRDLTNNRIIRKGKNLKKQKIEVSPNKIIFPGITKGFSRLQVVPLKKGYISINNRVFRGKINFIHRASSNILVVNEIGLEDYVRGIICKEIAPWWPMDALKAQSIIARTYALYQKQFTKNKDFDLTDDVYSQVYGGKTSERWRTNRAVNLTRGKSITFGGVLFPAYYHATCGGHTEDALQLWNVELLPLKGVYCSFCNGSPHFRWKQEISLKEIKSKLADKGYLCPEIISDVEIIARNSSGRVIHLRISGQDEILEVSAKDFRQALGPNVIRSTNFTLRVAFGIAYFEGLGWGHGVGLCQWGMYFMAKNGYSFEQILKYYFPQSKVQLLKLESGQ